MKLGATHEAGPQRMAAIHAVVRSPVSLVRSSGIRKD
jgi:hypothetical protein